MKKKMSPKRRDFLKITAAGAAGIALASGGIDKVFAASSRTAAGPSPLNQWPGRVVINFNKGASPTAVGGTPTAAQIILIKKMVDDSIKLLTGQTDIGLAWKAIFPSSGANALSLTTKIAIKVPLGCNNTLSTPHYGSVQAITEGLQQMTIGTTKFPAANITLYDGACSNNLNTAGYTAVNFPGITMVYGSYGTNYTDGAEDNSNPPVKQQYSTVLHNADFLINVFSPRGHGSPFGNVTLGFKNHWGTYVNPSNHHNAPEAGQFLRSSHCTGVVYNKNVLSVCSAIYGQYEGNGPGGTPQNFGRYSQYMDTTSTNLNSTTIMMGTDPVSLEMQAIKLMRIQGQKTYAVADMPDYLKASGGVVVSGTNWPPNPSAPTVMDNIGVIDESKMTILRILNGVTLSSIVQQSQLQAGGSGSFVVAKHVEGHNSTFIEFKLPADHIGKEASISIFDLKGRLVRRISRQVLGALNHLSWDEMDARGALVKKGMYIVRLDCDRMRQSSQFKILR